MRRPDSRSADKRAAGFVRAHLGARAFEAFTGTDFPAWQAFCHLLELYGREPTDLAIVALASCLALAQATDGVLLPFVQSIAGVLDWGYVRQLWPRIVAELGEQRLPPGASLYSAIERDCHGNILRRWGTGAAA